MNSHHLMSLMLLCMLFILTSTYCSRYLVYVMPCWIFCCMKVVAWFFIWDWENWLTSLKCFTFCILSSNRASLGWSIFWKSLMAWPYFYSTWDNSVDGSVIRVYTLSCSLFMLKIRLNSSSSSFREPTLDSSCWRESFILSVIRWNSLVVSL